MVLTNRTHDNQEK